MGKCYEIKCTFCKKPITYYEGMGFSIHYFHCNTCGKEKSRKNFSISPMNMKCMCGGNFTTELIKICPYCKSKLSAKLFNESVITLWD